MRLGRWSGVVTVALAVGACAEPPLPEAYRDLALGMSVERLLEARPDVRSAGPGRLISPETPAAFRIIDGHVSGIRILVKAPGSEAILRHYEEVFAADKVQGAAYSYDIDDHLLSLYSVKGGVELLYGVDPGSPNAALSANAEAPLVAQPVAPSPGPSVYVRRTSRPPTPASFPVGATIGGIDVWTLRLAATSTAQLSLRLILGLGSSDEQPAGQGGTAVLAELALSKVAADAAEANVDIGARVQRASTVFWARGAGDDAARVAVKLASQLARTRPLGPAELDLAYAASLRQGIAAEIDRHALEDLVLHAMFPNGPYTTAPVERRRPPPRLDEVNARLAEFAGAPLVIVAAGGMRERYVDPIAKAAGRRPSDSRQWRPKPALPNRTSRPMANPSVAIDGVWLRASSPQDFAMLSIAEALLTRRASRLLRIEGGAQSAPLAVIGGGRSPASYLVLITIGAGAAAGALDLAGRSAISALTDVPRGAKLRDLAAEARAGIVRRLATADDAADLMAEYAMARARPSWVRTILQRLDEATEQEAKRFMVEISREDRMFSVRWGPEG